MLSRQRCYERCMRRDGWAPVCVFSPKFPHTTPRLPQTRWVMPNACTMRCQMRFARYGEYAELRVDRKTRGE